MTPIWLSNNESCHKREMTVMTDIRTAKLLYYYLQCLFQLAIFWS